jgi:hypothetical protein
MTLRAHMFWHGDPPRRLERLAMRSFLAQGYALTVWTYTPQPSLPPGATLADAAEILPQSALFTNRRGSIASFTDWFRYLVLSRHGGLWTDSDVIALRPASALPAHKFLVTQWEWFHRRLRPRGWKITLNNNVIFNPTPTKGDLVDLALALAERFPKDAIDWGELGPDLLTALSRLHPAHGYAIMPPGFANPIGYGQSPTTLLRPNPPRLKPETAFLHAYGEMWRRAGISPDAPFPPGSLLATLAKNFGEPNP